MRIRFPVLAGVILLAAAQFATAAGLQQVHGRLPATVANRAPIGKLPATNHLRLAVGLPLRNQEALADLLRELYNPTSPTYRHFLTPAEFAERFGPTPADYEAVAAFARANGLRVTERHPNRVLLDVEGSVADIEKALHVRMNNYRHPTENRNFYAPDAEPALALDVPLLGISGLDNYARPRPRYQMREETNRSHAVPRSGSGSAGDYLGKDFRAAYAPDTALTGAGQVVGLLEFDGYVASDITDYENLAGLPNVPLTNVLIDGFSGVPANLPAVLEVSLDIEMAVSMAPGLSQIIMYEAGPSGNWHDLLNRIANDNLAKQISCSWYNPSGGADPIADQIWLQMAAQGQTFFTASGDKDAYSGLIDFPDDSPYITQVGGTTLSTTGPIGSYVSETVWNWGQGVGSGGGISTQYGIPDWQTNISMAANFGSTTMRNTPDVALTADNIYVRANGGQDYHGIGGTSCAAPLWAGFMALINQQAAITGRPPAGFINPAVSAIASSSYYVGGFHDITKGNNGTSTHFPAVPGYDLATGWGTPRGQALINAFEPLVKVTLPPNATEGDGLLAGAGQITLFVATSNSLVVTLTSSDTNLIQVPDQVTVPAGQSNATFDLTVLDNAILDGTRRPTVSATVSGLGTDVASLQVFDTETAVLSITAPAAATEGDAPVLATVGVSAAPGADVQVTLTSSDTSVLTVPPSVTISSGQTSASFRVGIVDDRIIDHDRFATITAHVQNWTEGQAGMTIHDNERTNLAVTLPVSAEENAGVLSNAGLIKLPGVVLTNLPVSLVSDNTNKLLVPAAAVVPAGQDHVSFDLTLVDNAIADGNQTVTVTAAAADFANGSASLLVIDDESPAVPSHPRPANLAVNVPANTALTWFNGLGNELVTNGGFETGTLSGWSQDGSDLGRFIIDDGTVNPGSGDAPTPPYAGNFSVIGVDGGPLTFDLYQDVTIPTNVSYAGLSWVQRLRNFAAAFDAYQTYVVRICDTNNHVLATAFASTSADPLLGDWTPKSYDLTAFAGRTVRVMFWVYPKQGYLETYLDSVSVQAEVTAPNVTNDVYFGTNPTPGPAEFQGSTTNASWPLPLLNPATTYYWQIVAHSNATTVGPVWQFTTAGADHFDISSIATPQSVSNSFPVTITAKDAFNTTVSNFTGPAALTANVLGTGSTIVITEMKPFLSLRAVGFANVSTNPVNINGWQITVYDIDSYPLPLTTLTIPVVSGPGLGNIVPPGGAFQMVDGGNSASPGVYPFFELNTNIDWVPSPAIPMAVLLRDSNGAIVDFACVGSANAADITVPVSIPSNQWSGRSIPGDSDGSRDYERVGNQNHHNFTDWTVAYPGNTNGLVLPFIGNEKTLPLVPGNTSAFTGGTWTGSVSILAPSNNIVLRADDGSGVIGSSNPFDVVYSNQAPLIFAQPVNQTWYAGQTATFSVSADGSQPLSYQWLVNSNAISTADNATATNATLVVSNLQLGQSGSVYSVLVTNQFGATNSSNVVLTVNQPPSCVPPPSGLVSWWTGEGYAADLAGINDGKLQGGASYIPGEVGQAFNFDGLSGDMFVPDSPSLRLTTQLTIEAWINPAITNGDQTIVAKMLGGASPVGYQFALTASNQLVGQFNGLNMPWPSAVIKAPIPIVPGTWNHVAWTYDQPMMKLYFNGLLVASTNVGLQSIATSDAYLSVGGMLGSYFHGGIDEVGIYNTALSDAQILGIYNAAVAGKCQIMARPRIISQPANRSVIPGGTTNFLVTAGGTTPLYYQWWFNNSNILASVNPTATTPTLVLTNAQPTDAGNYSVVISNAVGVTNSISVPLTIVYPPTITLDPASTSVGSGCTVTFRCAATGTPNFTYQWQMNGSNLSGPFLATNVFGTRTTNLTISNVTLANLGDYRVIVKNSYASVTSAVARLTFDHPPVPGSTIVQRYPGGGIHLNASTLPANATDQDGDSISLAGVSSNSLAGGIVGLTNGIITYLPPANYTNADSFNYTLSDGHCGGTTNGTVLVQVRTDINPASQITITQPGDGSVQVLFNGIPGYTYRVQSTDSLDAPDWRDVAALTADAFGNFTYVDHPATNSPVRYYRSAWP